MCICGASARVSGEAPPLRNARVEPIARMARVPSPLIPAPVASKTESMQTGTSRSTRTSAS